MQRLVLAFLACLYGGVAHAQNISVAQSSASTDWKVIENDFVEVIYPSARKDDAILVANLIEHYSAVVGLTYGISKPQKVSLVLRTEMAEPNGFVTLAPRRTEWFTSATYSPIVPALDWLQILAIHEYRHVQQNDAFRTSTVVYLDYLFGDLGQALAGAFAKKPWMAEGDAVWAETRYTDSGRGRSPRFLARLKGILLGGKTPSYDQFVNGTYNDLLVNQYVYGYILIANGYRKFGEDFWSKVSREGAEFPHPFRFPTAFKNVSGQDFSSFYDETFADLRRQWQDDAFPGLKKTDYAEENSPAVVDGKTYFVRYDLDSFPTIYRRESERDTKIKELPYHRDLLRADFSARHAVYPELRPDWRYGYVGTSDLHLIDLENGATKAITSGERFYNPHFNASGDKIAAAQFKDDGAWSLAILDLTGQKLGTVDLPGLKLVEGIFLDETHLVAIANDAQGKKSLIRIKRSDHSWETLIPPSRNGLFALQSNGKGSILFEAQFKGSTDVFLYDAAVKSLRRCTQSKIGAYAPNFAGLVGFVYSEETPHGTQLVQAALSQCTQLPVESLIDRNYLGQTASDNYSGFPVVDFAEQPSIARKNAERYAERDYGMFEKRAFIPHSWNFFAGRGIGLMLQGDNYLGDFGYTLSIGRDGEENQPYSEVQIDFKRYPLIVSLVGDVSRRGTEALFEPLRLHWKESSYGLRFSLPTLSATGLWTGSSLLSYDARSLRTWSYELEDSKLDRDEDFIRMEGTWAFSYLKKRKFRSLLPPWGVTGTLIYSDAEVSSRAFGQMEFYTPGAFANDGFQWTMSGETYEKDGAYRFPSPESDPLGYTYARGYAYKSSDRYQKFSGNYMFPLAYPDYNLGSFWYLKRNYLNLFGDASEAFAAGQRKVMDSYGSELMFESVFFRAIPLTFGVRYMRLASERKDKFEGFTTARSVF